MVEPREFTFYSTSNEALGASNKNTDGSKYEVMFDPPITFPKSATNMRLSVQDAEVWWTVPNVITGVNDTMYIDGPDTSDVLQSFVVVLDQGLYDLGGMNAAILRDLETQDAKVSPDPIISMVGDTSTQKVVITLNYATSEVDFTQADTPRDILGFNSQIVGPDAGAPVHEVAPNIAQFNQINYFLLHSDIVQGGLRVNSSIEQIIARILIDVQPGTQILYEPQHAPTTDVGHLAGKEVDIATFWLTDDQNRLINTADQDFSVRIKISYDIPLINTLPNRRAHHNL